VFSKHELKAHILNAEYAFSVKQSGKQFLIIACERSPGKAELIAVDKTATFFVIVGAFDNLQESNT
jgi:hypothetical protein